MRAASMWFVVVLGIASFAGAQEPTHETPKADAGIRLNVQVSAAGQPVTGLALQDFQILDNRNGVNVASVKELTPATEPVHAIILLDAVNVRYTEVSYEREQIVRFLRANGGKLAVSTSIAVLTDKGVHLNPGFSRDGNVLAAMLEKYGISLRSITQSAGFWGAAERFEVSTTSLREMSTYAATIPGRKLFLWVSPGWPLLSGPRVQLDRKQEQGTFDYVVKMSNELRKANVTLYSLNPLGASEDLLYANYYKQFTKGVTKPEDVQYGNLGLQVIAEQSGGLALQGNTDVAGMLTRCLHDATSWYEVRLSAAGGGDNAAYHHIEAKVDRPNVQVRTRDGYYAEQ